VTFRWHLASPGVWRLNANLGMNQSWCYTISGGTKLTGIPASTQARELALVVMSLYDSIKSKESSDSASAKSSSTKNSSSSR
jgi:hypothetical protein